jgi:hypothetical protein
LGQELQNALDDSDLITGLEVGIHRQRENFGSRLFGNREISLLVSEVRVGLLQMKGYGIVNPGMNVRFDKMLLKAFAVLHPDHIEVIYGAGPLRLARSNDLFKRR